MSLPPPSMNSPGVTDQLDSGATATPAKELPPVRVVAAESIEENVVVVDERGWLRRLHARSGVVWETAFGIVSLVFFLAVLATIPVLNLLSLGYLLEVSGRVARTGRWRDGLIGTRKAAKAGSLVLGTWLMILPLRFLSAVWADAQLIAPASDRTAGLQVALITCTVLMVGHILCAWYHGGRLRDFFWPVTWPVLLLLALLRGERVANWLPPIRLAADVLRWRWYGTARDAVWNYVNGLRLPHYFWLGARGFAGAISWLFIPTLLLIGATALPKDGPAIAVGLLGAPLLAVVLLYLPFLQTHFAAENRFLAMFELGTVRRQFTRAPLAYWLALFATLLFAIPLYLFKIEFLPQEVTALPSLVFVVFIWPARWITGWAVGRARHRDQPRFFLSRWAARLAAIPVVAIFVLIVFISRYVLWYGAWSLFEQHAFLVPAPFLGQ